jgi:hypothetical protein
MHALQTPEIAHSIVPECKNLQVLFLLLLELILIETLALPLVSLTLNLGSLDLSLGLQLLYNFSTRKQFILELNLKLQSITEI